MAIKELIDVDKIQKDLNSVFEKFNESIFGNYKRPSINISQNSNFVLISVEMHNLEKDDIVLRLNHNSLEILGEHKRKIIKKGSEESTYRGYKATIGIPVHVDIDNIKSEYKNNILKITIPKMKTKIGSKLNIS